MTDPYIDYRILPDIPLIPLITTQAAEVRPVEKWGPEWDWQYESSDPAPADEHEADADKDYPVARGSH